MRALPDTMQTVLAFLFVAFASVAVLGCVCAGAASKHESCKPEGARK